MKIYLDDLRDAPDGWVRAYWPSEVFELMKSNHVTDISLDHDLGDDKIGTGYDVVRFIEEKVFHDPSFHVPNIIIHSANPVGMAKMNACIVSINRFKKLL